MYLHMASYSQMGAKYCSRIGVLQSVDMVVDQGKMAYLTHIN